MNILIIDNSTAYTGALKCALNQAVLLSDQHTVSFLLPTESTATSIVEEKGFSVYRLPMREIKRSIGALIKYPFFLIANSIRLHVLVKKHQIDIVQCNDFYNLLGAVLRLFDPGIRLIVYIRFLPAVMPAPLRKFWTAVAQRYAEQVVAVSDAVLNQLPKHPKNRRIYDPVFLSEKYPPPAAASSMYINLLYLGNYIPGKGQNFALEAFMLAYHQEPRLRLRFVGGDMGLAKNKDFRQGLQTLVAQEQLTDCVSFSGFVDDIEQTMKESAIALNFSEAESFSMTCLEAAFYGIPLIATRCGGPEEIICHNETGILVPVGDIVAMSEAILTLARNPSLRQQFADRGRDYVRQKFQVAHFVQQMDEIIKNK